MLKQTICRKSIGLLQRRTVSHNEVGCDFGVPISVSKIRKLSFNIISSSDNNTSGSISSSTSNNRSSSGGHNSSSSSIRIDSSSTNSSRY